MTPSQLSFLNMHGENLMSAILLLMSLSELSGDEDTEACSAGQIHDILAWEKWLTSETKHSNRDKQTVCRSRVFVDQSKHGTASETKISKSTSNKVNKKLKGSKKKRKKEKRRKQARLKKERITKKTNQSSKGKYIKDTHD